MTSALPALAIAAATLALAAPAAAQVPDLTGCLAIADVQQRVNCYDAIARAQQQARAGAPAAMPPSSPEAAPSSPPQVATAPAAIPAPTPQQQFGFSAARREAARNVDREPDELQYTVAAVSPSGPGMYTLTTTDGAVWQLRDITRTYRVPRKGDAVSIRKGGLGSFYMDADRQAGVRAVRLE